MMTFCTEVGPPGDGSWQVYESVEIAPQKYFHREIPPGLSAHWLRMTAESDSVATAHLHYT